MIIQRIDNNIDIIIPGEPDINSMSTLELLDQIETENRLYYFERMKRKQQRSNRKSTLYRIGQLVSSL